MDINRMELINLLINDNKQGLISLLVETRKGLPDNKAVLYTDMYPHWQTDISVKVNERYQYDGKLYKVVQEHTTAETWKPDITPALFTVIDVMHAGTLTDPIPASANMEYIKGKYYTQNGTIYLMNREGMNYGEGVTLAYLPSELIGIYFEVV